MTREAVRAISITALEAVREGALFMGVIGTRGELVDPFAHIDAPIWSENEVPESIVETAYDYCGSSQEERQEISTTLSSTLQIFRGGLFAHITHSVEEQMILPMEIMSITSRRVFR